MNTTNNNLTLEMVKRAVYSWSIRHREAGYTNEQLAYLSNEYFEDLQSEGVTANQFDKAVREVRKTSKFFPKMADVLFCIRAVRERPSITYNQIQISDTTSNHDLTPEEIERNRERMKHITDMLSGSLSIEDAVRAVEWTTIKEFGK